jgi:hypothetical protein
MLGDAVVGTLYENGDLVVSGSGSMTDYTSTTAPFGTSGNPNTSIKKVIIKDGVTTVGNRAFSYCSGLTSVTIPDSVTSIGNAAFYYCSSLTSITIPDSVTSIGYSAFQSCTSLTSVYFQGNAPTYGTNIFASTPTNLTVYRKATATGWPSVGANWADKATALWKD